MKLQVRGAQAHFGTGDARPRKLDRTILFVHGAGFDHAVWTMPARFFVRRGLDVLAPDLPAHGRSLGAPLETIEDMASWMLAALDVLELRSVIAVGHSMGSLVVSELARQAPERVERVALLGTSDPMGVGAPLLDAARDDHSAAFVMANTWSHSGRGRLGSSQNPGMSNLISGARWLERMSPGVYYADLNACNAYRSESGPLGCPTLVISGSEDKMTHPKAGRAVAALHGARSVVLEGCGHAMLSEQPNQVLDALADFVLGDRQED